jgi:Protein of unknown function (DUF3618)
MADVTTQRLEDSRDTRDPRQIEAEIERMRAEFGNTVAALVDKVDVRRRAKRTIAHSDVPVVPTAIGAVAATGLVVLWLWRSRS